MRTALDSFISLLGDNRDYVLLALAVLVLVEGAIIVLWARRAIRVQRRLDAALAESERAGARAAAAEAKAKQLPQTYRVADASRDELAGGVTVRDGERQVYSAGGRTTALPPAPPAAPNRIAPAAPATAPTAAATPQPAHPEQPAEYTTPVAEKAAAWVLPEVAASQPDGAPAGHAQTPTGHAQTPAGQAQPPGLPTPPRPVLNWSPADLGGGTAPAEPTPAPAELMPAPAPQTPAPQTPAPTTLGWSGSSVPVEPAPDFAVISDPEALASFVPAPRPSHANGNGNGHSQSNGVTHAAVAWDMAMLDSNDDAVDDLPSTGDILLVEDDPTITKLYKVLLESRGYTVRVAADGLEGLDRANEKRPDLVLLDIMMPRMNGIAFLQAVRSSALRDLPVVVLSNFMEKQLVDDALSLGALEYMVKAQTRPEALAGALPHWLRGERAFTS